MPNSWKMMMSLEFLSMRSGIEFGLGKVFFTYFLQEHDCEKWHYNLNVKAYREHLVLHLKINDRG